MYTLFLVPLKNDNVMNSITLSIIEHNLSAAEARSLELAFEFLDNWVGEASGQTVSFTEPFIQRFNAAIEALRGHPRGRGIRFQGSIRQGTPQAGSVYCITARLRVQSGYPTREDEDIVLF
jgi:hypothetical protein